MLPADNARSEPQLGRWSYWRGDTMRDRKRASKWSEVVWEIDSCHVRVTLYLRSALAVHTVCRPAVGLD